MRAFNFKDEKRRVRKSDWTWAVMLAKDPKLKEAWEKELAKEKDGKSND